MREQVMLSIELSHSDRLGVQDIHLHPLIHIATHTGLTLQSCYCLLEYLITLTHK